MSNPEKASGRMLAGKCFCGAVHYAVADEFVYAANCHCSNCRRTTGSAFKPFAGVERHKLGITGGVDKLLVFGDETGNDTHCKLCGSLLFSVVRDGAFVHVAMGTLVDDPTIRPTKHIFVGSKAPWFTIADDLPQYEEHVSAAGPVNHREYTVMVDDNFHYMEEDERWELGKFPTVEAAIAACRKLVEDSLIESYKPGMTAAQLYAQYTSFGDEPFIVAPPGGPKGVIFSARDYARDRVEALCAAASPPRPGDS